MEQTIAIQKLNDGQVLIYNLVLEEYGWIFRRIDDSMFGVSGHFKNKQDCIDSAKRLELLVYSQI